MGVLEGKEYQGKIDFLPSSQISQALPLASKIYHVGILYFTRRRLQKKQKKPWPSIYVALIDDLQNEENKQLIENLDFDLGELIRKTFEYANSLPKVDYKQIMIDADEGRSKDMGYHQDPLIQIYFRLFFKCYRHAKNAGRHKGTARK